MLGVPGRIPEVTEGPQPLTGLFVDPTGGLELTQPVGQSATQLAGSRPLFVVQIAGLAGVLLQVVELRIGAQDEVVGVLDQRGEVAPAEVEPREVGLGVDDPMRCGHRVVGQQGLAVQARGQRSPEEVENRRIDVDEPHGLLEDGSPAGTSRQLEEQRHAKDLRVEEGTVLQVAVVPQTLTVIRQQDDQSAVVHTERPELGQQSTHDVIGCRHLAVVG